MEIFSKKIWSISQSQFSIIVFESTKLKEVWSIIVGKYNLLGEFHKLKDMFLMGRGELFATFLDTAKNLLNKPIDQNFEYNINYYFQKSISRMLLDEEDWPTKFKVISFEPTEKYFTLDNRGEFDTKICSNFMRNSAKIEF
ncbi:gamma-tubulin complex component 4 isoform X2 [Brachionus plicatilis]|uniref:Gamma-tubulin complex component 4 isoform X2 n=1 Tax=Brachionus plicatilis TaxID=10195 RepID=A0A3M7QAJ2_BRAPC|nr:gamma-tubulin complex component 4 isoform X2 [Brachionus plicatilis]